MLEERYAAYEDWPDDCVAWNRLSILSVDFNVHLTNTNSNVSISYVRTFSFEYED